MIRVSGTLVRNIRRFLSSPRRNNNNLNENARGDLEWKYGRNERGKEGFSLPLPLVG